MADEHNDTTEPAHFDPEQLPLTPEPEVVEAAADAVQCLTEKGLNEAMNRYNGWRADAPLPPDDRK